MATLCFLCSTLFAQKQKDCNKISSEEKMYELSIIWKEISYNFGNMDNCPNLDLDSLYRAYIPLVSSTKNDFDYWKMLQRFMAHFNNGHTMMIGVPEYLPKYLAYPMLQTSYQNGFVIVENFGQRYKEFLTVGDTILKINNIDALSYFKTFHLSYVCSSNETYKIDGAMFDFNNKCNLMWRNKPIKLEIKKGNNHKKVTVFSDYYLDSELRQNNDEWFYNEQINKYLNSFEYDTVADFAYIALTACNENFQKDFETNYSTIQKCKNLIIDISNNVGGYSSYPDAVIGYLVDNDSIKNATTLHRYNNGWWKSYYSFVPESEKEHTVDIQDDKMYYLNHTFQCFNTCFEDVFSEKNHIPKTQRYQGNVFVIIGRNTVSAAEGFAAKLSQNKKIVFLGEKTYGANAQPLYLTLPSGIKLMINTGKMYDFENHDVSSGFNPDFNVDLSECYKAKSKKEILNNLIPIIRKFTDIQSFTH